MYTCAVTPGKSHIVAWNAERATLINMVLTPISALPRRPPWGSAGIWKVNHEMLHQKVTILSHRISGYEVKLRTDKGFSTRQFQCLYRGYAARYWTLARYVFRKSQKATKSTLIWLHYPQSQGYQVRWTAPDWYTTTFQCYSVSRSAWYLNLNWSCCLILICSVRVFNFMLLKQKGKKNKGFV